MVLLSRQDAVELALVVLVLLISAPLRFINLGYSEFQDDEKKAMIRSTQEDSALSYLISQRKGPLQYLVAQIPLSITGDRKNELAQRLPFAIANLASVAVFFLLIKKLTRSDLAALIGSSLFSVNGFVVAFARIAQYQSLNLFLSLLALYFYADLKIGSKNLLRSSLLGTLFYSLSLLSHWDAVYYLVPIVYFYISFLRRKDIDSKTKLKTTKLSLLLGGLLILPFLIPYSVFHMTNEKSVDYFSRRVGVSTFDWSSHKFIFELYNPYLALSVLVPLLAWSLIFLRKNFPYFLWFALNFLVIFILMTKPGTHIYNYVVPAIFLITYTVGVASEKFGKPVKIVMLCVFIAVTTALYYQSYVLFVDHSSEYPWDSKKVLGQVTKRYVEKEILTFGFPHFRNLKEINNIMSALDSSCGYLTNEGKEITQAYLDPKYGLTGKCYFVLLIKRPFVSTRDGTEFAQLGGKKPIYKYTRNGEALAKLYFVQK